MASMTLKGIARTLISLAAIGARATQKLCETETQAQSENRNLTLCRVLANSARTSEPDLPSLMVSAVDSGSLVLSAYYAYRQQGEQHPTFPQPRNAPPQARATNAAQHQNRATNPTSARASSTTLQTRLSFKQRLANIQFDDSNIPDDFLDPINYEIMENPVCVLTQTRNQSNQVISNHRNYDAQVFQNLRECPFSRTPFLEQNPNTALKNRIEDFVSNAENQHASRNRTRLGLAA